MKNNLISEKLEPTLVDNEWGKTFFTQLYWHLFMKRAPEDIAREVELITKLSHLTLEKTVLDVCCGVADVANSLVSRQASGIEWSEDYARLAKTLSPKVKLYHDNALSIDLKEQFDVVYNWYSSFAYFDNTNNQKLLSNCSNWLKEDGVFLLEAYNAYHVIKNFKPIHNYSHQIDHEVYSTTRISQIDYTTRRLNQTWTIKNSQGHTQTYDTFTILYLMDELVNLLKPYFSSIEVWGRNAQGQLEDFSLDSPRYVIRAKK